jgi:hypothetical protein
MFMRFALGNVAAELKSQSWPYAMRFLAAMAAVAFVVAAPTLATANVYYPSLLGVERDTGMLYEISTDDASIHEIGSTGLGNLASLEFDSLGNLYGFTSGSSASLYLIDPADASVTRVGSLGADFVFEAGLAIGADGVAYGTNLRNSSFPKLFSISLDTGAVTTIGTIAGAPHDINGLALRDDGMLVGLDRETNALLEIDPLTATSSIISIIDAKVGSVGGMTVAGAMAWFSTAGPESSTPGSNELYSFDLYTGEQTLVGGFSGSIGGAGISGLAVVPEPSTAMLVGLGFSILAVRRRRSRAARVPFA